LINARRHGGRLLRAGEACVAAWHGLVAWCRPAEEVRLYDTSPLASAKFRRTACRLDRHRVNRSRAIVFSPFGLGVLDVAVGKWVYDRAVAAGLDHCLSDFFYETVR
jgi:hypothetical protein